MESATVNPILRDSRYFEEQVACRMACPVNTDARGYIIAIAQGRFEDAYRIARKPNPLSWICAWVCAAPCEDACRRGKIDKPLAIRALKRFACMQHGKNGEASPLIEIRRDQKVAVIGSGAAGLACAHDLALLGYSVTVFDALSVAGGLCYTNILSYRLPRDVIAREVEFIRRLGVEFVAGKAIGKDLPFEDLRKAGYKAVFLGVGGYEPIRMGIPGEELQGVRPGEQVLEQLSFAGPVELGKRTIVVGGGNTAMDCARAGVRKGAEVVLLYRRTRVEMPAKDHEIEEAEEEGVRFEYLVSPLEAIGEGGRLTGLRCVRNRLGEPDESGRRRPVPISGSEFFIPAESLLTALGRTVKIPWLPKEIKTGRGGRIVIDSQTGETSLPGVFAGGDAARGPATIIEAVKDGRTAARGIHHKLGNGPLCQEKECSLTESPCHRMLTDYDRIKRHPVPAIPEDRRKSWNEVEMGFTPELAMEEARRCLLCHLNIVLDPKRCILCGGCVDVCPSDCFAIVPSDTVSLPSHGEQYPIDSKEMKGEFGTWEHVEGATMLFDGDRCIRCALCVERCPTKALSVQSFKIKGVME